MKLEQAEILGHVMDLTSFEHFVMNANDVGASFCAICWSILKTGGGYRVELLMCAMDDIVEHLAMNVNDIVEPVNQ